MINIKFYNFKTNSKSKGGEKKHNICYQKPHLLPHILHTNCAVYNRQQEKALFYFLLVFNYSEPEQRVMATDGTWVPGLQAFDTWLASVDTRIFALSYNSGVILSECSFSPGPYISLTAVMQLAEWCGRSPVGVLPALWDAQSWWEREQQYKAWLCFQMLPAKGPQADWQGSWVGL